MSSAASSKTCFIEHFGVSEVGNSAALYTYTACLSAVDIVYANKSDGCLIKYFCTKILRSFCPNLFSKIYNKNARNAPFIWSFIPDASGHRDVYLNIAIQCICNVYLVNSPNALLRSAFSRKKIQNKFPKFLLNIISKKNIYICLNSYACNRGSACEKLGGLGPLVLEEIENAQTVHKPKLKFIYRL
jgi:hypothetical protein